MPFLSFRTKRIGSEKSIKLNTCGSKISRLRLEMTILGQPPGGKLIALIAGTEIAMKHKKEKFR